MSHPDLSILNYSPGRRVKNEYLFAEANQRIYNMTHTVLQQSGSTDFLVEFVCECADADCHNKLNLPIQAFAEAHAEPDHFFVEPGHFHDDIERVMKRYDTHWIVQKIIPAEA